MEIGRLFGLPAHPLIVHAVVVLVPLCSSGVAVSALWPAARWRLAWVLLELTIVTVAMVPLATGSGEVLEEMVKENSLVERHAELGDDYLPYAFALLLGAVAVAAGPPRAVRAASASWHSKPAPSSSLRTCYPEAMQDESGRTSKTSQVDQPFGVTGKCIDADQRGGRQADLIV